MEVGGVVKGLHTMYVGMEAARETQFLRGICIAKLVLIVRKVNYEHFDFTVGSIRAVYGVREYGACT